MKCWPIIAGLSFLVFAIVDITGCTFHLKKKYRENVRIRASRKTVGMLSLIIGTSGILHSFQTDMLSLQANIIVAICLGAFLIQTFYVWHIMNIAAKEDKDNGGA